MNMSAADKQSLNAWMALLRDTEKAVVSAACNAANATALGVDTTTVNGAAGT